MRALVLFSFLLLAAAPAAAQTPYEQHVVVTGTAEPATFADLPRAVYVITREEIARLPVRSVDDLLAYLASVDLQARGPGGLQADFSVRGATFAQTLVLVDGVRLNDLQTGHHNGDIPLLVDDVERIELLAGPGASLYGADAFGGAINIITRKAGRGRSAAASAGSSGYADGRARWSGRAGGQVQSAAAGFSRSDGFEPDREFRTALVGGTARFGASSALTLAHVDKAFGANGFYGPSPSREWTNQTLAVLDQPLEGRRGWDAGLRGVYRTHGDRFLYDRRRPGQFENRHRSHAAALSVRGDRDVTAALRLHVGAEAGGDWIRSSNLGDHAIAHTSLATELRDRVGARTTIVGGLRYDAYSRFGTAWSPSLAASTWVAAPLKIRAAVGHAFRIPTFTELYYRDPNNEGQATLHPERGWSYEIGADWLPAPRWVATATAFARRDRDVIDWVRSSPQVPWRSANIRRLQTRGLELAARRSVGADASAGVEYAYVASDADPVTLLSKYVLDYARHRVAATASLALPGAIDLGGRAGWTRRADGRDYALVDVRVAHPLRRVRVFLEGTNLLDESYQAVRGVDMPGRAVRAGLEVPAF